MLNEFKNISKEDYIIWDNKNNAPKEALDIVYHYTSVMELINNGFKLYEGEEIVRMTDLPLKWQRLFDAELEKYK